MFEWLDVAQLIEDATFTTSARDALKMERSAWERCDKHRKELEDQIREMDQALGEHVARLRAAEQGCHCIEAHEPNCPLVM